MSRSRHPLRHRAAAVALGLSVCLGLAAGDPAAAQAPAACPPVVQVPRPQDLAAAQAQAADRGFLWRLRKAGRVSFLFGTLHLGKLSWAFQGPKVSRALGGADVVALEVDLTDDATLRALALASRATPVDETAGLAAQAHAAPPLPPELQARLDRQRERACVPAEQLAPLHPVIQALTLSSLAGRWDGLDPAYAQELILGGMARHRKQPIVALETVALQIDTLIPKDAAEARAAVEQMLDDIEQDRSRSVLRRLAQAWEQGDLATLESYADWCDCVRTPVDRAQLRRLNDDRNPALADRIDALHQQGKRVFAAVGALHMTGEQALPRLLATRGYEVERISLRRE